jgi:2,4-dienoyl-CoA reductase-like NADH-dependent reductase (Old Yellow Enzyme family)
MTMLRTVEKFLRQTGMTPTRFGREAVRDPRIVLDMRKGREPTERMCRRLQHFIASHADRYPHAGADA